MSITVGPRTILVIITVGPHTTVMMMVGPHTTVVVITVGLRTTVVIMVGPHTTVVSIPFPPPMLPKICISFFMTAYPSDHTFQQPASLNFCHLHRTSWIYRSPML